MSNRIYTIGADGALDPLEEERFCTEDKLQELIANHPELLAGEQMRPDNPLRWLLVTREKGIAAAAGSGARWSVDHLIVDQDAVPTLVEVKRGSNREIRRTVVGQMMEYAAHAALTWTAEELRQTFENSAKERCIDPEEALDNLLRADEPTDAEEFWQKVANNLSARYLRLLFVADYIPDELKRVVEFLNEQMDRIEVLAVEIKQFRGRSADIPPTLVPQVIGITTIQRSGQKPGRGQRLTRQSFLEDFDDAGERDAAARLLDVTQRGGGFLEWGSGSVSIRVRSSAWPRPITLAWLNPPSRPESKGASHFSFGSDKNLLSQAQDDLRPILQGWLDSFSGYGFAEHIPDNTWMNLYSVGYAAAAQNIGTLADRLAEALSELKSL